ncbi:class I SAM-dependent methyltransferase [Ruegeria atlantica]|uniref:class I SAM-dependent methyltransferase n=1 Tax=Ruegeria atlantica TaxID=81569 RepID=UPI002494A714|nr:class I SAM-dependent methyltransferase [Ruegeria atlantica]
MQESTPSWQDLLGLDVDYYRDNQPDLAELSDAELIEHFNLHGRAEGRVGAKEALRAELVKTVSRYKSILEIGPFCNPCVTGSNVSYFDVLDSSGLQQRAKAIGYNTASVPDVEFVSPTGDLAIVDRKFDAVISSHCIEHQPDLIAHLVQVQRILKEGGRYFMLIPDKRYCFDFALAESNVAQIVAAHRNGRKTHRIESVIEHRALTTHNDTGRHWQGDHFDAGWEERIAKRTDAALAEFDAAGGGYIDVHAWQFTPKSFASLVSQLRLMKLINLEVQDVYETPKGRNEFTVILKK